MSLGARVIHLSLAYPKTLMLLAGLLFVGLGSQIPRISIDTDPENMLPADQAERLFHKKVKADFALYDLIVVGVVNERHAEGVFNTASLSRVYELTRGIESIDGVVRQELLSPATVDDIQPDGPGVVRFAWLMDKAPTTPAAVDSIRSALERNPLLYGTLISEDGKAIAIYVPIRDKSASHRIASAIEALIADFTGEEQYFISGLPVAEDTFGVEMFRQMGIAAPLAGLIIFLLMLFFFRSLSLIISPMIVAFITVGATMGLLIGMGYTVHIMSSMIPIFLMPIAVVDAVHILSEFADLYPRIGKRRATIVRVLEHLFRPMLFTSLTSAAGFASLALAPIPPVRVFGIFVAIGILLAFLLTITFIPAYIMLLSDARIARLRQAPQTQGQRLASWLARIGPGTLSASKPLLVAALLLLALSVVGISRIRINDNPVRWFESDHRIRVADRVLNKHFGGTYDAYLVLTVDSAAAPAAPQPIDTLLLEGQREQGIDLRPQWEAIMATTASLPAESMFDVRIDAVLSLMDEADDVAAELWDEVLLLLEEQQSAAKYFQTPSALRYVEALQTDLQQSGRVGKSNSLVDIVKTVHRELREGAEEYFRLPGSAAGIAQTLLSYQSSHRPQDVWHFVRPDFRATVLWLQLRSGDNQDMLALTRHVDDYLERQPLPEGVRLQWAGLTYLNVVWQQAMVQGMLEALLGSFLIVFLMMLLLFRSLWLGLLAMLPLSITITFIYGLIGLLGKDYDMPIAVLSSLTLGLSVDFSIHFLQRARTLYAELGDWPATVGQLFQEPARAITRNAIVVAIGFLPLLASPLIPYNTVGFFLAAIMATSCFATLVLLPGLLRMTGKRLAVRTKT